MKARSSIFVCLLFSLLIVFASKPYLDRTLKNEPLQFIVWDTYGYYLYLPALFIHNDPALSKDWPEKLNAKYQPTITFYQIKYFENGNRGIAYHGGLSICFLPGFLAGHAIATCFGFEADGLSTPYQIGVLINSLIYSLLSLFVLRKLLLRYFTDSITALVLSVIFFGTNLFVVLGLSLGGPHNVLFLTNGLYLLCIIHWFETKRIKYALMAGLLLGLNTIIRPTELILIVIPVFWNIGKLTLWKQQLLYFWSNRKSVLLFLLGTALFISLQLFYWKYTSGMFKYNMHDLTLVLHKPYLFNFLFSYKKGWLLYTPVMLFGLASFYYIWKSKKEMFWSFSVYTALIIYALASWECWWYASSYGQRPIVESYPFFAIGFGCLFTGIHTLDRSKKRLIYGLLSLFILLNIFQTIQYIKGVIHPERMSKKYYWRTFGKLEATEEDKKYLEKDRGFYVYEVFNEDIAQYRSHLLYQDSYEGVKDGDTTMLSDERAHSGNRAVRLDTVKKFSPSYTFKFYDITDKEYVWVRASAWVYLTDTIDSQHKNSALVVYTLNNDKVNKYRAQELMPMGIKPQTWTHISVDYMTPYITDTDAKVVVNYWNIGDQKLFVDDMQVEVLEPLDLY